MKMRTTMTIAGIMLLAIAVTGQADEGKHLFILSGQSNMVRVNPGVSFTPTVAKAFGAENVIVVRSAKGSQPIRRWLKDWEPAKGETPESIGELYDVLMSEVTTAIKGHKLATVTFVWMQGERDARTKNGEVYEKCLKALIGQIRKDMKREDVNFVIGRLSDFAMKNQHWIMVRETQVKVAEEDPYGAWVNTDDLNDKPDKNGVMKNDLHYTREGAEELGKRFADKAIELIKKQ